MRLCGGMVHRGEGFAWRETEASLHGYRNRVAERGKHRRTAPGALFFKKKFDNGLFSSSILRGSRPDAVPGSANEADPENINPMKPPSVSLGYVIVFVKDVAASLTFYEEAFGLSRRFFNDDNGIAYGEMDTGAAVLAFASLELAKAHLKEEIVVASPDKAPLGFEVALLTPDVAALYDRARAAGAAAVSGPELKPWGQTVAYVRDNSGCLVELCTPLA
jgi:lactoylglutathione lyase